ncbi:unnamed protein product [Durusdinium trenchii]|uniref:Actin-related protein 10 n=1 Tax=Durusdinium trenchii TaxID=1381693 RepID=A0ABP0T0Q0_9DINO
MAEEAAQAAPAVPKVTAPALASRLASSGLSLPKVPASCSSLAPVPVPRLRHPVCPRAPGKAENAGVEHGRGVAGSWGGGVAGSQDNERPGPEENRNAFNIAEIERKHWCCVSEKPGPRRAAPRAIFRSTELQRKQRLGPDVDATLSLEEWVKAPRYALAWGAFGGMIFFQHLHLSPKDRRIVVCDAVFSSRPFRSALATVLFKVFSVHSLCFVLENVLPLYLTGLHTGLVIDLGYSSSRVLPTFAGVPVLSAFSDASCGAKHLLQAPTSLVPTLIEALKVSLSTSEEAAKALEDETLLAPRLSHAADRMGADRWEDCLVCACYVACDFPEDRTPSPWDANVRIAGSEKGLRVPAACRCAATDTGRGFGLDRTGCGRSE